MNENGRENPHESCKNYEGYTVGMQFIQHGALEVCTLRKVPMDDCNGGNPLRPRAFECIGITFVCDDDGNFSRDLSTLNCLDNRC